MVSTAEQDLIDAPGTHEAARRAWPALRMLPVADTTSCASAVVVAAHPDDEVLGAGGTIAMLAARGIPLRLVALTDGEASHPHEPGSIGARRVAETAAALAAQTGPVLPAGIVAPFIRDAEVFFPVSHR